MSSEVREHSEPVYVGSEDQVLLKAEQGVYFQQCCDCGLTHRVEVEGNKGDLWFRHVNIGRQFPDDLVPQTVIREGAKGEF